MGVGVPVGEAVTEGVGELVGVGDALRVVEGVGLAVMVVDGVGLAVLVVDGVGDALRVVDGVGVGVCVGVADGDTATAIVRRGPSRYTVEPTSLA